MGNTPSNQSGQSSAGNTASPTRRASGSAHNLRSSPAQTPRSQANNVLPHRHHAGRHAQRSDVPQGPNASSNQASSSPSSHRPVSPRRRKSLELPDLNNKLTFTNTTVQGAGSDQLHAETVDAQTAAGSERVRSPLAGPPPTHYAYEEEGSLGNTPVNSKRVSLTSGTRARSPQDSNVRITSSIGEGMDRDASTRSSATGMGTREGMPIPGAKPARRIVTGQDEPDNPYFPPVARQRQPPTPGLPNYSHSPHTGNSGSGVGLVHVEHAEQAEFDFTGRDRLTVNTNIPPTGPRQPSPARPAPAVVTTEHHHMVPPQDVLVSALPHGATGDIRSDIEGTRALETPLASLDTPLALDPNQTPLGLVPGAGISGRLGEEEEESASIPTLVTWNEGGRNVYVTGTFADNGWKARLKMNKSTHDFSLMLNLPPGTHRLKFIVDDHWRCSSELQTATDGDGNLVNWLEVDPPKKQIDSHEDWATAEWAQKVSGAEMEQDDGSLWTNVIPPALVNFISIEERGKDEPPEGMTQGAFDKYQQNLQQLLATVPAPPTVPRHLKDPILNTSPKELEGTIGGTAGDDNSILPVPNHVVLNHLTAAAIRNGTLAVGTTTRYKRKYISTLLYRPVPSAD